MSTCNHDPTITSTTDYGTLDKSLHGYCRFCFVDMAKYGNRQWIAYKSHKAAMRRGLWGTRRS